MIVTSILKKGDKPTEEQIRAIRKAQELPIVFDDDSPQMTEKMKEAFLKAARVRDRKLAQED